MTSERAKKEKRKQLKSIEELNAEVAGLREHLDQILGVRSREIQNIHHLVSTNAQLADRVQQLNFYVQEVSSFFEEEDLRERFDKYIEDKAKKLEDEAKEVEKEEVKEIKGD